MPDVHSFRQTRRFALLEEASEQQQPGLKPAHPAQAPQDPTAFINHIASQIQQHKGQVKPSISKPHTIAHLPSTATATHHLTTSSASNTPSSSSSSSTNPLLPIGLTIGALLLLAMGMTVYFLYLRPYHRRRRRGANTARYNTNGSSDNKPAQLSTGEKIQSSATPEYHAAPAEAQRRARSTVLRLMDEGMWKQQGKCPLGKNGGGKNRDEDADVERGEGVPEDPAHWNARLEPRREYQVDGVIPIGYDYSGYDYGLRRPNASAAEAEAAPAASGVGEANRTSTHEREYFSTVSPVSDYSDDARRWTGSPVSPIALPEKVHQMHRGGDGGMGVGFV